MDYIDGGSLSALLNRRGSLSENEALPIILTVADTLGYMHKQNHFYLDMKPANIMLLQRCRLRFVKAVCQNTTTLTPCYTPGYAPSEQSNPRSMVFTAATDVYALGLLYSSTRSQKSSDEQEVLW